MKVRCVVGWFLGSLYAVDIEASLSARGELEADEGPLGRLRARKRPSSHGVAADTESVGSLPCTQECTFTCTMTDISHSVHSVYEIRFLYNDIMYGIVQYWKFPAFEIFHVMFFYFDEHLTNLDCVHSSIW
jgi:hypothetical protein